jgi:hypothetical protein
MLMEFAMLSSTTKIQIQIHNKHWKKKYKIVELNIANSINII